jgi:DNA adenine methylase
MLGAGEAARRRKATHEPLQSAKPARARRAVAVVAASSPGDAVARPFCKWVGGKRQLLTHILPLVPESFGKYHEPFVGGGAVFFALASGRAGGRPGMRAHLSDTNERLVRTYRGIQHDVDAVVRELGTYRHDRDFFNRVREADIDARSDAEVAAWLVYLNKTGYNGLYRVNSKNRFNVPFGDYKNPLILDEDNLRACSRALARTRATVRCEDFDKVAERAQRGDFVYFDPPYVPLSATSSFTSYTSDGFGIDEQRRLRDLALALKKKGVKVLLSNSSARAVYELYERGFTIHTAFASRSINCKPGGRGRIAELLIE